MINDPTYEELDRIRLAAKAHAEGISSVFEPMLQGIMPKPQTPEEQRKHWRYVFAASAMQAYCTADPSHSYQQQANDAVLLADALLAELEKPHV